MRIAHIVRRYSRAEWGGTETVVCATVAEQRRRGDEPRIFCTSALQPPDGTQEAEAFAYFYPYFPLSAADRDALDRKGGNPFSPALFRAVRAFRPDVIHIHAGGRLACQAIKLAELLGIPSVMSLHGGAVAVPPQETAQMLKPIRGKLRYGGILDRLLGLRFDPLARASALICISQAERRELERRYPDQRIHYLPNGIAPGVFAHRPFSTAARVLCLSRIDYQKNQAALLDLLAARADVEVELIGPVTAPWYRDQVLERAKTLGVSNRLTLINGLPPDSTELNAAFERADVFVLPSVHEPFGIVALEAMQRGVPLIASAVGGLVDFVRDGENGLLFNPNEKGSLVAAFDRLNPTLAAKLVSGGYATVRNYEWPRIVAGLSKIYQLLLPVPHGKVLYGAGVRPTLISILVRTWNDAAFITRTLDAIAAQECTIPHEVLVCDDASSDGTGELLAARHDIRLVPRPSGDYRPGRTLNALVRAAKGEIVVFNNADAVPLDADWLQSLTAPLVAGTADATFANQVPRSDAEPLVRKDSERAFGDGSVSARWPRFFSLASSAARRDDLLANPFDEQLLYSEDVEWVNRRAGFRRQYVAAARVDHSHNYTRTQLARRFYGEGFADQQIFGDPVPCRLRVVLQAGREILRDVAYLLKSHSLSLRFVGESIRRRLTQRLSWWRGMRDAAASTSPATAPREGVVRRILFAGVYPNLNGGLERFAARAAETLRSAGYEVECVGDVPRSLKPYDLVVMQKLPRRLKDLRRLKCRYGERLRFYAHDHELYCLRRHYYDPLRRPCSRTYSAFPCRLCATVTHPRGIPRALCRDMAGFLREMREVKTFVQGDYMRTNLLKCGFAADRLVTVAPFWTDSVRVRTDFMPRQADGSRPLRILFVGQLVAGKGVHLLIESVARLTIPYTLTIVGAGRDERRLRSRAAKVTNGNIRFEGWQADVPRYLAAADVVVVPSLWNEPFCMSGVEALAVGVPVVAFNRGGIGDWLKPGVTGLFAEPTAESLAETLRTIAAPAKLAHLSETAADFVRAHYSTDNFLKGILA